MALNDEIKSIRQKLGLSKKEFAEKLKISEIYVTSIERPIKDNRVFLPSVDVLKRLASVAAKNDNEKKIIERNLLIERTKLAMPKELKLFFDKTAEDKSYVISAGMPLDFINRLRKDIKFFETSSENNCIENSTEISETELKLVLNGQLILSRKQVVSLAMLLKQPVEEYLILSDYMPDSVKNAINMGKKTQAFFRKLGSLPPEDVDAMVDVFDRIFMMCRKENAENAGEDGGNMP